MFGADPITIQKFHPQFAGDWNLGATTVLDAQLGKKKEVRGRGRSFRPHKELGRVAQRGRRAQ